MGNQPKDEGSQGLLGCCRLESCTLELVALSTIRASERKDPMHGR